MHAVRHGLAPVTGAERHAIALAAAFRVQSSAHASAAITDVDLRSLAAGISEGRSPRLAGARGPALTTARQLTRALPPPPRVR